MSDINELIHAIGLAEKLAAGVAREADRFPTEDVTRIREALASARIRAEEVRISADLICEESELDDRLKRAVEAIAASEGKTCVPFRPAGCYISSDEVGSSEWQEAKRSGSKVELVRLRQEASDRLVAAQEAESRYKIGVAQGTVERDADRASDLAMERALRSVVFLKLHDMKVPSGGEAWLEPHKSPINPGIDLLRAREALMIAEHRRDVDLLDRREAVARAETAFVKYRNEMREAPVPVDDQDDDRPLTDDEKARIVERAERCIRRRDVRMRNRMVHLDRTAFEISSIHGNLRVRFQTDADHGRVRHVEVTDYHPSMADDLAELHALPIPASSMDPAIDPYCDLLDRIRHGFKILTRVVAREAISAGERTSDRDAILARLERIRQAA